jgi:hypothetical protein
VATVIARPCPTAWLVRLGASTPQPMGSTLGSRQHDIGAQTRLMPLQLSLHSDFHHKFVVHIVTLT